MKCTENGGCPIAEHFDSLCDFWEKSEGLDCHLTSDLFPLVRAIFAGEWSCEKCDYRDDEIPRQCWHFNMRTNIPCAAWKPKEQE